MAAGHSFCSIACKISFVCAHRSAAHFPFSSHTMAKKRKLDSKPEAEATNCEPQEEQRNPWEEEEEEEQHEEELDKEEPEEVPAETETTRTNATANTTSVGAPSTSDGEAEEEEEEDDAESILKLLEPFSKDQLIDLVCDAALKHPYVLENVNRIGDVDPVHGKIFVHGVGWDPNAETLTNVFKKYGKIEDCNVVCEKISGKSEGYGFILFKH